MATNDAELTSGRNNLTNYLTLLKTKMNYPLNDTLRIDTQVDLLAQEMSETAESIYFDARRQNPTAKIADFNLRQSQLRYSIAKGNYYPIHIGRIPDQLFHRGHGSYRSVALVQKSVPR